MAGALDAAINDALLLYARCQELTQQDGNADDADSSQPSGDVGTSEAHDAISNVKKARLLRVARMLVDSNPRIRNKGMASVGNFMNSFYELTEDVLLHVWSTLYYAAWLSDKPLVQRDFFVRASLLHLRLPCPQAKTRFFCSFFRVLIAEWGKLDRHRTNKFLLFSRIFLAEWMRVMRLMKWEESFVKAAVEFLCEEVLLHSSARGVALHVVDILTYEFRTLLDPVVHPASRSGISGTFLTPEQKQEERLCAFSWLFVPFLRCCCFSKDATLVSRIHERTLQTLGPQDVDLQFVAAALFALASDKRVRSENRKQFFATYEYFKEEADRLTADGEDSSDRRIGSFNKASFAQFMVQRVISDSACQKQKKDRQQPHDPLKEFPNPQKRPRCESWSVAGDESEPDGGVAASPQGSPAPSKNSKRERKRLRLAQAQQRQEREPFPDANQAADEASRGTSAQKVAKNKLGKVQPTKGGASSYGGDSVATNGLRLPIRSSGSKDVACAATSTNRSSSRRGVASSCNGAHAEAPTGPPSSPADTQSTEGIRTPSGSECSAIDSIPTSVQASGASQGAAPLDEKQLGEPRSRRRSLRISEANPSSKRVLFNLKKNKVVAFSRHAPSLAVGPASPLPAKKCSRGSSAEPSPTSSCNSPVAPPRGILRAAKELGPPTCEETAPMPPVKKSQRPSWWGGSPEELMVILRRALAQRMGSSSNLVSSKKKKKKTKLKKMKRSAKNKSPSTV